MVVARGYGVRKLGDACARGWPHPLRHRLQQQGLHRRGARRARRRGQGGVGRAGDPLSAVVPAVGPVRHARADGARPAGPPERPWPGRRRPPVVAAVHLYAARGRRAAALRPARDQLPQCLRLRQRAVSRGRRGDRDAERAEVGGVHPYPDPGEGRDEHVPPAIRHHGQWRQCGHAARARRRARAGRPAVRLRQHQSGRRHPVERRGHGEVDAGPAAPRPARGRHTPVFGGHVARDLVPGHADAEPGSTAGAGAARQRSSRATRWD